MAKNDIKLIIQGGALCAAFSFMALFIPIVGVIFNYFSLLPIFYVGLTLGIRAYAMAMAIPLIMSICLPGPSLQFFCVTLAAPSVAILYWHFLKTKDTYSYSSVDILHLLTSRFLGIIILGFCYLKFSNNLFFNSIWLANLHQQVAEIIQLAKVQTSTKNIVESLPGVFAFCWLTMVWLNFQMAYAMALKSNKAIRQPLISQNQTLKPIWDIILIAAIWLMLLNDLLAGPEILQIFARTCLCISAFPLLIDGLEIIQLITKAHKIPRYTIILSMVITFMLVWPMIFVVLLGLVEPWYGLKQKYLSKLN